MNDTHHPDRPDRDVIALLDRAGIEPSDDFRSHLADELRAVASGGNVATLQSARDRRDDRRSRTPLLVGAAAAVALVVAIAVVADRDASDLTPSVSTPDGDESSVPGRTVDPDALTDADLLAALSDHRWLALDRFDVPVAPSLVSSMQVTGTADATLSGHDGCNPYGGRFAISGTRIETDGFDAEQRDCGLDVLQLDAGHTIEMLTGADAFVLRDADSRPLARFVDEQSLPFATADDVVDTWYVDDTQIEIQPLGVGGMFCLSIRWADTDGRITLDITDPDGPDCSDVIDLDLRDSLLALQDLIATSPEVRLGPDGLVVTDGTTAILLRRLPVAEVDPDGVTIGAGALFGLEPGAGISPDDVLGAASIALGTPDRDTGWIDLAEIEKRSPVRCAGEYRELMWGDLVVGFSRLGSRTDLLFWNVGDQRAILGNMVFDERDVTSVSNLTTEDGLRVGDPITGLDQRFGMRRFDWSLDGADPDAEIYRIGVSTRAPGARVGDIGSADRGGAYLVIDGRVAAFGAGDASC